MCGRFLNRHDRSEYRYWVDSDWDDDEQIEISYNIAPTQLVSIIHFDEGGLRRLYRARWGLIPSWAKDAKIASKMINARADTVATKPAFRASWKRRRCVVPMSGYYEWKGDKGDKQPYFIHGSDDKPLAAAGLYESWKDPETGEIIDTVAVITTDSAPDLRAVHERMPVLISLAQHKLWLDPATPPEVAAQLLLPMSGLVAVPIGKRVNNARNNGPDLLDPLAK